MGDDEPTGKRATAFVAGATGYVGWHVVRQLRALGVRTIAHVRPDSRRLQEWWWRFADQGAEPDATPWKLPRMAETLRQAAPTMVFGLLGTTRSRMESLERAGGDPQAASYETVDYGLTALLVEAAVLSDHTPRFLLLSATGAGPAAKGEYMRWRYRAEQSVMVSGLPFVIARPALVTGADREDDRPRERFASNVVDAALGLGRRVGWTKPWRSYRSIDGAGLARALIRLAMSNDVIDRIVERADLDDAPSP